MVFEYCEMSLDKYLADAIYPLSRQNVKTICTMILKGLKEIHSKGIIHRVIKLTLNLLFDLI
jgi:serine/threonine protein kinase